MKFVVSAIALSRLLEEATGSGVQWVVALLHSAGGVACSVATIYLIPQAVRSFLEVDVR